MVYDNANNSLLQVDNLTLRHRSPTGATTILKEVNLTLRRGEILGLIGESGAGKSTLGNVILGLLNPEFERVAGSILFDGMSLDDMDERQWTKIRGRRISAIFQDHTASLDPLMAIGPQLEEAILASIDETLRDEAYEVAIDLLTRVGIPDARERYNSYPHQFSGGQRQRIVIAIALAGAPDIIIADEPTSALDATVQRQILALLRELVDETGVSIILVTHDMGVVSDITDRVVVMRYGEVIEQGPTAAILDAPSREYTRSLLKAVPRLRLSDQREAPSKTETVASSPDAHGNAEHHVPAKPILVVRNVTKTFSGSGLGWFRKGSDKVALENVSVELTRGTITGIVGESGSGKSTIGRIIAGLETASGGTLSIDDMNFDVARPGHRSGLLGQVQMIFQDPAISLNPRMTIGETLRESVRFGNTRAGDPEALIAGMLDRLQLAQPLVTRYPHQLSGGQKQRVCIARSLLAGPRIIVADEPTSALDVSVQAEIVALLKECVTEQGVSMLFISHDLALVQALCSSIYIFRNGQIEDAGSSDFIFARSQNPYTRGLIEARSSRFTH